MVMHYFHPVLEHGLPPSLNLNHNAYSIFPRIHVRREAWHAAHRKISSLPELSEWTLMQVSISLENGLPPAGAALEGVGMCL